MTRSLLAAGVILAGVAWGAPATMAADGPDTTTCTDPAAVTVVVDFTDLGGGVETGCAGTEPESGRAALLAAGFTATDSQPGFLCAIDSMPEPCPTTFDGSFWSYWHSTVDGEWTSYEVGADTSSPAPGELEGWRYNDGTTGPGIAPAAVAATVQAPSSAEPSAPAVERPRTSETSALSITLVVFTVAFVAVVVLIAVLVLARARRRTNEEE